MGLVAPVARRSVLLSRGSHRAASSPQDGVSLIQQSLDHLTIESDSFLHRLVKAGALGHVVQRRADLVHPRDVARMAPRTPRRIGAGRTAPEAAMLAAPS